MQMSSKYVVITIHLPKSNHFKLYNRIPKRLSEGINTLVESTETGYPSSCCIVNSCDKTDGGIV